MLKLVENIILQSSFELSCPACDSKTTFVRNGIQFECSDCHEQVSRDYVIAELMRERREK